MGYTIQINPDAPAYHINFDLFQLIDAAAAELELKYYTLSATNTVLRKLRTFTATNDEEAAVVTDLIAHLEADGTAELLIGY